MNYLAQDHQQLDHQKAKQKYANKHPKKLCLLIDDMQLALNVGSLFRLADAFAVETLYLTGYTPIPPNKKLKKSARSCEKYVNYEYFPDPMVVVNRLKQQNYTLISLEITDDSQDIRALSSYSYNNICLIMGAENQGVKQCLLNSSDHVVHIPMFGQNTSMNVATACAIAVFECIRSHY